MIDQGGGGGAVGVLDGPMPDWSDPVWSEPVAFDPGPVMDAGFVGEQLGRGRSQRWMIECIELLWVAAWADLHPGPEEEPSVTGGERSVRVGGEGTPEVAEFCTAELGTSLGLSVGLARSLLADVLDLRHRLPLLWRRVDDLAVEGRTACRIAAMTRSLSADGAALVDAAVVDLVGALPWRRLESIVWAKVIEADPELAAKFAESRRHSKRVVVGESSREGLSTVWACLETADAVWLDAMVEHLAARLAVFGALGTRDELRSQALGMLARPAEVVQFLAAPIPAPVKPDEGPRSPSLSRGPDRVEESRPVVPRPEMTEAQSGPVQSGPVRCVSESGWQARDRLFPQAGPGWPARSWWRQVGHDQFQTGPEPRTRPAAIDAGVRRGWGRLPAMPVVPDEPPPDLDWQDDPDHEQQTHWAAELATLGATPTLEPAASAARGHVTDPGPAGQRGPLPASAAELADALRTIGIERLRPPTVLNVHVSLEALTAGQGVCRVEDLGPHVLDVARRWLAGTTIRLNPVIDLPSGLTPCDAYEIPCIMRQHVMLRMPTSMFPWSPSRSRLDLDHTVPYSHGPPGQTRIENLAPFGRFEHRLVTHGRWQR